MTQKKQAMVKSEMDERKAELLKFSQTFKVGDSGASSLRLLLIIYTTSLSLTSPFLTILYPFWPRTKKGSGRFVKKLLRTHPQ